MLLFPYDFHKGEQLLIDFLLSSLVDKTQSGVKGGMCTFNKELDSTDKSSKI